MEEILKNKINSLYKLVSMNYTTTKYRYVSCD